VKEYERYICGTADYRGLVFSAGLAAAEDGHLNLNETVLSGSGQEEKYRNPR
jgi:hypothetical protein